MKQLLIEHMPFKVDKLLVEQSIKESKASSVLTENKGQHIANWSDKR